MLGGTCSPRVAGEVGLATSVLQSRGYVLAVTARLDTAPRLRKRDRQTPPVTSLDARLTPAAYTGPPENGRGVARRMAIAGRAQ
jgi:hypothetical protein